MKVLRLNKEFKSLTREQKRVRIAEDSLQQLLLQRLSPVEGVYFDGRIPLSEKANEKAHNEYFPKMLSIINKEISSPVKPFTCEACALGGMFFGLFCSEAKMSLEGGTEGVTHFDYFSEARLEVKSDEIIKHLSKFFPAWNLGQIEAAFEQSTITVTNAKRKDYETSKKRGWRAYDAATEYYTRNDKHIEAIQNKLKLDLAGGGFVHICMNIIHHNGYFDPYFTGAFSKEVSALKKRLLAEAKEKGI